MADVKLSTVVGGGGLKEVFEVFLTSGTWTKPANIIGDEIFVDAIGGGGGGATGTTSDIMMQGGNSGEIILGKRFDVTALPTVAITIGANGSGGTTADGGGGGNTVIGALQTLLGGDGGVSSGSLGTGAFNPQGSNIGGLGHFANAADTLAGNIPSYAQDGMGEHGGKGGLSYFTVSADAMGGGGGGGGILPDGVDYISAPNPTFSSATGNGTMSRPLGGAGYGAGGGGGVHKLNSNTKLSNGGDGVDGLVVIRYKVSL